MNADNDLSKSRKKEAQQSRRPVYYRNSQGRGGSSRYKYYNSENVASTADTSAAISECNNNPNDTGAASSNFSSDNVTKSNNFRGTSRQTGSRYSSPQHSNYRNYPKEFKRSNKNLNYSSHRGDQDSSEYSPTNDVPNPPQRGQIVGGRYIRKQPNQPPVTNSRTYSDLQSETVETERNFNKHYSYKYGNSHAYHGNEQQNVKKINDFYNNRETNGYSNQSTSQNIPYQVRNSNRNSSNTYFQPSQSAKFQTQGAAVEETDNKNSFLKKRFSPVKHGEDDKATQRGRGYCFCFPFLSKNYQE